MRAYLDGLYYDAMARAYQQAYDCMEKALQAPGSTLLELGAYNGGLLSDARHSFRNASRYSGIEWNRDAVEAATARGLNITQGDLNAPLPYENEQFDTVLGLSVVEHLLNPCLCLKEAWRVLKPGGSLIILTPNISTYFTAIQLLLGRMPSSGPHPDSDILNDANAIYQVKKSDSPYADGDTPIHRHLVVFSYHALQRFLQELQPRQLKGWAYGYYPLPQTVAPFFERLDPYHCHQMVFCARK